MSAKNLLYTAVTSQGGQESDNTEGDSELPSELEPDSGSDWLSDTASRTRSPFQEDDQDRQSNRLGVGFIRRITGKLKVGGAAGRGSTGSEGGEYKVYPWRWFMLGTLSLINLSNGMVRIICGMHQVCNAPSYNYCRCG